MSKHHLVLAFLIVATLPLPIKTVFAAPSAQIQNDTSYISSALGYYYIVGEVLNTGDVALRFIFITATLKDASGVVLDSIQGVAESQFLPTNGKAPFRIIESDSNKASRVASYTLALTFSPVTEPLTVDLVVQNVGSSTNSLGWLEVVGEVHNNGQSESRYTQVIATFYDSQGRVVYVDSTYTTPEHIPSGATNSFKLTVSDKGQIPKINNWVLFAESQQYTSVPEFPFSILIAAIVVSLTVVLSQRLKRDRVPLDARSPAESRAD
jgi:hypothetical protein